MAAVNNREKFWAMTAQEWALSDSAKPEYTGEAVQMG
jgi:hypothetical protein